MNINMQGLSFLSYPRSNATADRMERQQKRDNTIAFFEQQKENLKNLKTDSIEDIQRKLGMFENYNDQINAAKVIVRTQAPATTPPSSRCREQASTSVPPPPPSPSTRLR